MEEFRERSQPQLGKVHDPIKDTMNVPPDHTFGVLFKPDEYGAGDLIHGRAPDKYLRGHEHQRAVLAAVRHHLKKSNYHNFNDLKSAFSFYDKVPVYVCTTLGRGVGEAGYTSIRPSSYLIV